MAGNESLSFDELRQKFASLQESLGDIPLNELSDEQMAELRSATDSLIDATDRMAQPKQVQNG